MYGRWSILATVAVKFGSAVNSLYFWVKSVILFRSTNSTTIPGLLLLLHASDLLRNNQLTIKSCPLATYDVTPWAQSLGHFFLLPIRNADNIAGRCSLMMVLRTYHRAPLHSATGGFNRRPVFVGRLTSAPRPGHTSILRT